MERERVCEWSSGEDGRIAQPHQRGAEVSVGARPVDYDAGTANHVVDFPRRNLRSSPRKDGATLARSGVEAAPARHWRADDER